jgi:glycosyltransferase involved in cell wall biosynthesis
MLCGLPVILTDVGDIPALFEHGVNALLVPYGDQASLNEALMGILIDRALYARLRKGALAARVRFIERWGLPGQVAAWDAILDMTVERSGGCPPSRASSSEKAMS